MPKKKGHDSQQKLPKAPGGEGGSERASAPASKRRTRKVRKPKKRRHLPITSNPSRTSDDPRNSELPTTTNENQVSGVEENPANRSGSQQQEDPAGSTAIAPPIGKKRQHKTSNQRNKILSDPNAKPIAGRETISSNPNILDPSKPATPRDGPEDAVEVTKSKKSQKNSYDLPEGKESSAKKALNKWKSKSLQKLKNKSKPENVAIITKSKPSNNVNNGGKGAPLKKNKVSVVSKKLNNEDDDDESSSGSSYESVPETGPGLEFFEKTSEIIVFQRSEPLDFPVKDMLLSSYNVLNDKGETIFFIGETHRKCFLCHRFSHSLGIYSVQGILVMSVLRINQSCCSSGGGDVGHLVEADAIIYSEEMILQESKTAYHLTLPNYDFLGHYKIIDPDLEEHRHPYRYILLDAKFQETYYIQEVKPDDPLSDMVELFAESDRRPYMQIFFLHHKFGTIRSRSDLNKFGMRMDTTNCFQARFPPDITNVQKALILGLIAITKCQTISADEQCCETCCVLCCKTKCAIV